MSTRDSTPFEGQKYGLTSHALVIRDDPEMLIYASRSRNADKQWEVRSYSVNGQTVQISATSRFQAEVAAALVERFDDGEGKLRVEDEYSQTTPIRDGVPTVVAVAGLEWVVAWRFAMGDSRDEIAAATGCSPDEIDEHLTAVCNRVTGFPTAESAPEVGELVESVPSQYSLPVARTEERRLGDFIATTSGGA